MPCLSGSRVRPQAEPRDPEPQRDNRNAHAQDTKHGKPDKKEEGELKESGFHGKTSTNRSGLKPCLALPPCNYAVV